jgi:pyruvate dehydrogenase E2 component (dihydrolipoamide acetyltransferase)
MSIIETIIVPRESVNDESALIVDCSFANGGKVCTGDKLGEVETSKTILEIRSSQDGFVEYCGLVDEALDIGSPFAYIHDQPLSGATFGKPQITVKASTEEKGTRTTTVIFSKAAKALIEHENIDRQAFQHYSLVRTNDVRDYISTLRQAQECIDERFVIDGKSVISESSKVSPEKRREIEVLTTGQNQIASSVSARLSIPPHLINPERRAILGNLQSNLVPQILVVTCQLLKKYKLLNGFFLDDTIHVYSMTEIGYAVDLDEGLRVVNLGDISMEEPKAISRLLLESVNKCLNKTATVKLLSGSTFTVSDLSTTGITSFRPLINSYETAILALPSFDYKLSSMELTLIFDHRVTEGKYAAKFLIDLIALLEEKLGVDETSGEAR